MFSKQFLELRTKFFEAVHKMWPDYKVPTPYKSPELFFLSIAIGILDQLVSERQADKYEVKAEEMVVNGMLPTDLLGDMWETLWQDGVIDSGDQILDAAYEGSAALIRFHARPDQIRWVQWMKQSEYGHMSGTWVKTLPKGEKVDEEQYMQDEYGHTDAYKAAVYLNLYGHKKFETLAEAIEAYRVKGLIGKDKVWGYSERMGMLVTNANTGELVWEGWNGERCIAGIKDVINCASEGMI